MYPDRNEPDRFNHWRRARAMLMCSVVLPWIICHQAKARSLNSTGAVSPTASAQQIATATAEQSRAAAAQAQASLARAAAALAAMRQVQQDAAAAAQGAVPNGVVANGLMPQGGVTVSAQNRCGDSCSVLQLNTPASWTNADTTFAQTLQNGKYTVDIVQNQPKAILNWQTFNIGRATSVQFEQQSTDWVALNRVTDPSGSPTQILGQMSALGGVYVINRNGVIFGAGAQINIHALVASTLDVGQLGASQDARDNFFIKTGINAVNAFSVAPTTSPYVLDKLGNQKPNQEYAKENLNWGDVIVQPGAKITATTVDLDSPGFVYLFGRNVSNAGVISAPAGEVALLAARTVDLVSSNIFKLPSNVLPGGVNYRGTDFQITQFSENYTVGGQSTSNSLGANSYAAGTGFVRNDGLIETPRGITMMNGDRITIGQTGVISADTGITRNSMVELRAATSIDLEGTISAQAYTDPLIPSLPLGGSTGSTVQSFTPAYIELSAQSTVTVGTSGLISAPAATVVLRAIDLGSSVNVKTIYNTTTTGTLLNSLFGSSSDHYSVGSNSLGPQRVVLESGAVVDVAGLQGVELPASYNFIPVTLLGNVADMPLQRNSALLNEKLYIDIRASGTRSDGTNWVGTPLFDASGAVAAVGRSIRQLMTTGGSLTLQTDLTSLTSTITDHSVIVQPNAVVNVAGGSVNFLPGMVKSARLLGSDGRIYGLANADPNMTYIGFAGQFSVDHSRWHVTEYWSTVSQRYETGYSEAHDAGGITISTVTPQLLGQFYFGSMPGERQIAIGSAPSTTGGVINTQSKGDELPSQGYLVLNVPTSVAIVSSGSPASGQLATTGQTAANQDVTSSSPAVSAVTGANFTTGSQYQTVLSADTLSSYGLSLLKITSNDLLVTHNSDLGVPDASSAADLTLAAGGKFAIASGTIDVAGKISAPGGAISLLTDAFAASGGVNSTWFKPANTTSGKSDIFVEGVLDVSGRFTNDTGSYGTNMAGPAYINGGSISIATNSSSAVSDTTGNILLARGSLLDASSGGYVASSGVAKTASKGVLAGLGGSISLLLYQGVPFADQSASNPAVPRSGDVAVLQLDGALRAFGFASNGTLTLGVPKTITIDGTTHVAANSSIVTSLLGGSSAPQAVTLAVSRLTDGGFSSYLLQSTPDGWTTAAAAINIVAGVNLTLRQQNFDSRANYGSLSTGTHLSGSAALSFLPDDQRKPVNLTLKSDNILLDSGAAIITDPSAAVRFGGIPNYIVATADRERVAKTVLLRGSVIDHGGTVTVNAVNTWLGSQAVIDVSGILVANSRFGVPGSATTSGTLLAGGSFTIEAAPPNTTINALTGIYVPGTVPSGSSAVAEVGAQVDVSGYAATIQVSDGGRGPASSLQLWSDAGTVTIDTAGFVWGGTFTAKGGRAADGTQVVAADGKTPLANGGTLILGGGTMSLQQQSNNITAALASALATGQATLANLAGKSTGLITAVRPTSDTSSSTMFAAVDRLDAFENVFLYSGTAQNGAARIFTGLTGTTYGIADPNATDAPTLKPLTFAGSVNWTSDDGLSRLYIAARTMQSNATGSTVALAAPYMLLTGGGGTSSTSTNALYFGFKRTRTSDPTSDVIIAKTIDVESAAFAGFNDIELKSSGDIRLSTPKVADGLTSGDLARFSGKVTADGANLVLDAQRVYPASAVDFTIQTTGKVTFQATAGVNGTVPLSGGGSLTVYASSIDQNGSLFAPLGKITLGDDGTATTNTSKIKTTSVTLEPGSLTSVTLADTVVPYGVTVDGVNWYYNASLHPLLAGPSGTEPVLPSKGLVLNAVNVAVRQNATIDARGGGDLQAMEWVPGKGGTRDTLSTTPKGQTVYALIPSSNDPVAALDLHFTTTRSLDAGLTFIQGDVYPLAGQQVYLDGSNGVPAGTYTLYPAHYATIPGALRVVDYGSNVGRNIASGTSLPDGTVLVSGHYTQSVRPQGSSSGSELFAIQTSAVWRLYSEYSFNSANSYFTAKARHDGVVVPRLPVDGGRLAVIAQQELLLAGVSRMNPAPGGRSGELDISSGKLAVVSGAVDSNPYRDAGYVVVSAEQLNSFESVLIGGLRSDTSTGTRITGTASDIVVDTPLDPTTGAGALTLPEIMLVTQPGSTQQTISTAFQIVGFGGTGTAQANIAVPKGSGTINIVTGSVIASSGTIKVGAGRSFYFDPPTSMTAAQIASALHGTLDATGTTITGADLSTLPWVWETLSNNPSVPALASYPYGSQSGLGALFVATQDPTLSIAGPTGTPASPLTVQFSTIYSGALAVKRADGGTVTMTLPGSDVGRVTVEAGASITTNTMVLQGTATSSIDLNKPAASNPNASPAVIAANQVKITGRSIAIGSGAGENVILSQTNLAQLANVQSLSLKALTGDISFRGANLVNPVMQQLTLDARAITGTGGNSAIQVGGTVTLLNSSGSSGTSAVAGGRGTLDVAAADINFGGGSQAIAGFSQVNFTGDEQLFFQGVGALTLGTGSDVVGLQIVTPRILVGTNTALSDGTFAIVTAGAITSGDFANAPVRELAPPASSQLGGNLAITGGSIRIGGFVDAHNNLHLGNVIQAQAGTITLEAKTGDVTLDRGAYLAAGGYAKTLIDVTTYVPGGKVVLKATAGNVVTLGNSRASIPGAVSDASVIDVAQPEGGIGYGGEIDIVALAGRADLRGVLSGHGMQVLNSDGSRSSVMGLGGAFNLDTLGAVDLDTMAGLLGNGGFTGAINIHSRTGNLTLSQGSKLRSSTIILTADDTTWSSSTGYNGQVTIAGTIDASGYGNDAVHTIDGAGQAGGTVALFGYNSVTLTGSGKINASTEHSDERGGDVTMGISWGSQSWSKDPVTNVATGGIDLQPGSLIDVHGGTKGGLSGGTLTLRAPNDGANDVKIARIASNITGARSVTVESFVSFSTTDQGGINVSRLGWDGVVNPGGTTALQVSLVAVSASGVGSYTSVPTVTFSAPTGAVTALKSLSIATTSSWYTLPANFSANVVIEAPAGGTAATGFFTTDANGHPTFVITNGGSGFTGAPTTIRFYQNGQLVVTGLFQAADFNTPVLAAVGQAQGTAVMGLRSIALASSSPWYNLPANFTANLVIPSPNGGVNATGRIVVSAGGVPTITITSPGSGFTGAPATILFYTSGGDLIVTGHLSGSDFASAVMSVVGINVTSNGYGYSSAPTAMLSGGGSSGSTSAGTVSMGTFAAVTLKQYVQGIWTNPTNKEVKSYGFGAAVDRLLNPLAATLGNAVVHLKPGVELINPDPTINGGNITIASNWNLAAGTGLKLQSGVYDPTKASTTAFTYFDPNTSYVDFVYRYLANYGTAANPYYSVEAGALTLRAYNNINVNASISDGFFQFGDYLDSAYRAAIIGSSSSDSNGYFYGRTTSTIDGVYAVNYYKSVPYAPYRTTANLNAISPTAVNLAGSDLFPHNLIVCVSHCGTDAAQDGLQAITDPGSWSYRLTAGADTGSANPERVQSLATATTRNAGDVILASPTSASTITVPGTTVGSSFSVGINLPTMVRTGTGDIAVSAARDVNLKNASSPVPGVIYAAGVNTATYANPYVVDGSGSVSVPAQNIGGFLEPQVLGYAPSTSSVFNGLFYEYVFGPPTAAAFPTKGGDVSVVAQQDIKGYRNVTTGSNASTTLWNAYYTPWLMAQAGLSSSATTNTLGAGVFAPSGNSIAAQTAWWIQYGSFREGILSAGGNVTVEAGRDLIDVSVSLPTTGKVTGGLAALSSGVISQPVTHLFGSGNMEVRAGRNLLGGSYYEGSGHASILVRGRVDQNGVLTVGWDTTTKVLKTLPNYSLLAVDTGQISLVSVGSMAIGGVVNPAELHQQNISAANPAGSNLLMNTYGPDSGVSLTAVSGNLNISMPRTIGTIKWTTGLTYPASFEAIALGGDITTTGLVSNSGQNTALPGIVLTGSERGSFELLAQGNVDLTAGYTNLSFSAPSFSAGPSLLDTAFDPFQPNNGMTGAFSGRALAHRDDHDTNLARIYAVTGKISAVATTTTSSQTVGGKTTLAVSSYARIELNRPAHIYAGTDIVNLNAIVQNIYAADVTTIEAGRDILFNYAGASASTSTNPDLPAKVLGGPGLQIAGPGFLVVQAGRDLGPFLSLTRDNALYTKGQEGIASVGNASLWPVGNQYVPKGSSGIYDTLLLGPYSSITKRRNEQLSSSGASIIALFGVANGINYDGYTTYDPVTNQAVFHPGVISDYINPATASITDHNYLGDLRDFLASIGKTVTSDTAAWTAFQQLSPAQQHVFADQVFFAELKAVAESQKTNAGQYQRGYQVINTMFPSYWGYTQNALGGGTNGANAMVHTGDLDMLHATIQTRLGGDISLFGPGGAIRIGSLGLEPNSGILKPNDLGLLTLSGGAINSFTDGSVLVNSSRVMTQQGGDILMWSSNGDLDAGRGSKTTLSLPPLQVVFNSDDFQSVDLGGLVSGAGIAVVQTSKLAKKANAYLLTPRGTVDAGDAGISVSGDLIVAAVQVLNAGNIQVGGSTTGVPTVSVPNIGGLTAASSAAGSATRSTDQPTAAGGNRDRASVFIVEVVGYGGSDASSGQQPSQSPVERTPSSGDSEKRRRESSQ